MPQTTLSTAAEATERAAAWTQQADNGRFVLRLRQDPSGAFLGFSLTTAPTGQDGDANTGPLHEESHDATNDADHPQYQDTAATALERIQSALLPLSDRRVLIRTWLDVSFEVDVLSGVVADHLVVRQFTLTGIYPDSATRGPDGTCHLGIYAHVARLQGLEEESQQLPLILVPESAIPAPRSSNALLDIQFAAGQWDAHIITTVRLSAQTAGPHQLQLCASDGQVLWILPLILHGRGLTTRDARNEDGTEAAIHP